jgi:transcriptional regulator with XRE-family HTH domain
MVHAHPNVHIGVMPRARDADLHMAIGARLRRLRHAARLTQEQLASATGLQAAAVSRIESGTLGFTITSAAAIAGALGVPLAEMFDVDGHRAGSRIDEVEARLLQAWRDVPPGDRDTILRVVEIAARTR